MLSHAYMVYVGDRLFHWWAFPPEGQRQIAKLKWVQTYTASIMNMSIQLQDPRRLPSLCVSDVTDQQVLNDKPSMVVCQLLVTCFSSSMARP